MNVAAPQTRQSRKHAIGLAGEFLVAGELLRRGIMAAVTYGNAKQADVVAFIRDRATAIEVKSTSETKWVLGGRLPDESTSLWILVYLPVEESRPPDYFVLTSAELRALVLPRHEAYNERYRQKVYSGRGVASIERGVLSCTHRGAWHKVRDQLAGEQPAAPDRR